MVFCRRAIAAAAVLALSSVAWAQAPGAQPVEQSAPIAAAAAPAGMTRIPAGTVVQVEIAQVISSKTSTRGEAFALRLAEPIAVDGQVVVAAGAAGGGEVIDARPAGFGGRQGKLVVSGRFLELNGQRATIRGMSMMAAGENRSGEAMGVAMVPVIGIASLFVEGGEIQIPVGARATARLAADIDVPVTAPATASAAPVPAEPSEAEQSPEAPASNQP